MKIVRVGALCGLLGPAAAAVHHSEGACPSLTPGAASWPARISEAPRQSLYFRPVPDSVSPSLFMYFFIPFYLNSTQDGFIL